MEYRSYYDDDYDWPDAEFAPDEALARDAFGAIGLPPAEIDRLIRSGFIMYDLAPDVVIDRFYGGALRSIDLRTRIPLDHFKEWHLANARRQPSFSSPAVVYEARSHADLVKQVADLSDRVRVPLTFRGQVANHLLKREVSNHSLAIPDIGEISLLPSVWRRMRDRRPASFHSFTGLSLFDWSTVLYSQFDIAEIHRRHGALEASAGYPLSYSDLEECDDPLLRRFSSLALDLNMGKDHNLYDLLNTLLQHYGLLSSYLDLSADLDVALFFATHRFRPGQPATYEFTGTRSGEATLYVFAQERREMAAYEVDRVLGDLTALRPLRQACVVCRSGPAALNLPADFLVAVVQLRFEISPSEVPGVAALFPSTASDTFLAALLNNLWDPSLVTSF